MHLASVYGFSLPVNEGQLVILQLVYVNTPLSGRKNLQQEYKHKDALMHRALKSNHNT